MSRFTKEVRQEIVREFAIRHNGQYNAALFLEEVRTKGESHPAYHWFEWDAEIAAQAYQVEQARAFARDLRVTFKVENVNRDTPVKIRESVMPLVLSPMSGRKSGGGYVLVDPDDPAHMHEHCAQAVVALRAWINRYQAVILHIGEPIAYFEGVVKKLEDASAQADKAA